MLNSSSGGWEPSCLCTPGPARPEGEEYPEIQRMGSSAEVPREKNRQEKGGEEPPDKQCVSPISHSLSPFLLPLPPVLPLIDTWMHSLN